MEDNQEVFMRWMIVIMFVLVGCGEVTMVVDPDAGPAITNDDASVLSDASVLEVDAGVVDSATPVFPEDAGTPITDSGSEPADGGQSPAPDAGSLPVPDAGPLMDSGTPDAGTDAGGTSPPDAGTDAGSPASCSSGVRGCVAGVAGCSPVGLPSRISDGGACAIDQANQLWCWGHPSDPELVRLVECGVTHVGGWCFVQGSSVRCVPRNMEPAWVPRDPGLPGTYVRVAAFSDFGESVDATYAGGVCAIRADWSGIDCSHMPNVEADIDDGPVSVIRCLTGGTAWEPGIRAVEPSSAVSRQRDVVNCASGYRRAIEVSLLPGQEILGFYPSEYVDLSRSPVADWRGIITGTSAPGDCGFGPSTQCVLEHGGMVQAVFLDSVVVYGHEESYSGTVTIPARDATLVGGVMSHPYYGPPGSEYRPFGICVVGRQTGGEGGWIDTNGVICSPRVVNSRVPALARPVHYTELLLPRWL